MNQISDISRATSPAPVVGDPVGLRYRDSGGRFVDTTFDRVPVEEVLAGMPVREFRSYRGRKHYSGWYWSATTGGHVVYESRLELARILLADQDPQVVAIAAQPFRMEGFDGVRCAVMSLTCCWGSAMAASPWWMSRRHGGCPIRWWSSSSRDARGLCRARLRVRGVVGLRPGAAGEHPVPGGYRRDGLISAELVAAGAVAAASPVTMRDLERGLSTPERRGLCVRRCCICCGRGCCVRICRGRWTPIQPSRLLPGRWSGEYAHGDDCRRLLGVVRRRAGAGRAVRRPVGCAARP